jgi:glycosyltransferase involved in cell wall biosynthesis
MRIVFLCRYFYPHIGGVEKHCFKLGQELIKKGHKLTVITSSESLKQGSLGHLGRLKGASTTVVDGINVIYIKNGKVDWLEKFRAWRKLCKLKNIIERADIVHCHDIFYWYLPFKFIFPRKRVFITFHGYEGDKIPNRRAVFMHMVSEKLTMGNICIGDFFKKWYETEPTFVSYGATDVKKILLKKSASRRKNQNIKAMFLGRLEEETGIMDYLEALKLLKDKKINIELDVFGDGSLFTVAKAYAKLSNVKVSFKGFVEDAQKYIKNYDFVLTSRYLGILEALAFKKFIFAVYNNKIKRDYLKMTPFAKFISIADDSEDIVTEIKIYLKNKKGANVKIESGFNWVKKHSWKNLADLYLKLWTT